MTPEELAEREEHRRAKARQRALWRAARQAREAEVRRLRCPVCSHVFHKPQCPMGREDT